MKRRYMSLSRYEWLKKTVVAVFCATIGFVLLVAYSFKDYSACSWFFITSQQTVSAHWLVRASSYCMGLLFFLLGSACVLLIPFLFFVSYVMLYSSPKQERDRLIAFGVLIVCCALVGAWYSLKLLKNPFVCGGLLGHGLITFFKRRADAIVISLVINVALCTSLLTLFRLSYVQLFHGLCSLPWNQWFAYCYRKIMVVLSTLTYWCKKGIVYVLSSLHPQTFKQAGNAIVERELEELLYHAIITPPNDLVFQELNTVPTTCPQQENLPVSPGEQYTDVEEKNSPAEIYQLPPRELLTVQPSSSTQDEKEQYVTATALEEKLERFGINGKVVAIKKGPVITLFEYKPAIDTKISKILSLEDDLALALQAMTIRIIAPIPGTSVVGFEVANKNRQNVLFSTIIHTIGISSSLRLPLILGVDTIGVPVIVDLATLPHLLVAGATGSGKSVALNVFLAGLLYHCSPDYLKCILIDPKRLEFAAYHDIPHLLFPVVTQAHDAAPLLKWVVQTMEYRYKLLAQVGVRNIADYHALCKNDSTLEPMPYLLIMIDELSDLMMVVGKHIEESIARIAQMARAAGIHMIVATQRPSVDVITGVIKVNFPSRISFKVSSKTDSRTILDANGAEKLLGKGDMLYNDATSTLRRVHGAYLTDQEITKITDYVRSQQTVEYLNMQEELAHDQLQPSNDVDHALYQEIITFLTTVDEISISLLQRKFKIGYNRSARIIERLETEGFVMASHGGKTRKVIH